MNIIEFDDYREILKLKQTIIRKTNPAVTLDYLATKSRIQKSYISRVFNSQIHFTTEQLFIICNLLKLSDHEQRYCQLLLDYQKAINIEYKKYLMPEIKRYKDEYAGAREDVKGEYLMATADDIIKYYANSFVSIVHMYLCIDKFAKQPSKITSQLMITNEMLTEILTTLENLKIIERNSKGIKVIKNELHIPNANQLSKIHQANQRSLANSVFYRDTGRENYFFSASFSTSPETIKQIKQEFYNFLNKAQSLTEMSEDKEVYHLNFDLFTC